MRKIQVIGALLLILALALTACGQSSSAPTPTPSPSPAPAPSPSTAPQSGSEWDNILAAAKKEGAITVYSTSANQLMEASKDAMAKYGIKVSTVGGSGGELATRIAAEQRGKANVADLFTGGWSTQMESARDGYVQPITTALPALAEKDVWKVDLFKYDSTKSAAVYGRGITPSIIVNSDLVRSGEIQSWQDLLDPRWRDKMVMTDPRSGTGPGTSGLFAWWKVLGEDYWKKLVAQRPSLTVNPELPVQQIALGEKSIAIFPNFLRIAPAIKAGAPVQIVHLKEGTSYYVTGVALIKNAPHPNASLVFLNWMYTKEGQIAIGNAANVYTIRKDVSDSWINVKEYRPENYTLLEPPNNVDLQGNQKAVEFAKTIFGAR